MSSSRGKKDKDYMGSEKWKFGKKSNGRSSPENSIGLVFGAPLQQAVEATRLDNSTALPGVAVRCIEYLDAKGLQEVGLYRIPGSTTTVNKLRAIFDSGSDLAFGEEGEDPNAIATLLKMFLRELPETVLTPTLESEYHQCLSSYDHERSMADPAYEAQIVEDLTRVTLQLPEENYQLLAWLMCHLARVDYYSDVNKMNSSNLGLIFCPTMGITSVLFRYFLRNSEKIFPLPKPEPTPSDAQGTENTSSNEVVSKTSQSGRDNGRGDEYNETADDDVFYDLSASVLASPPRNQAKRESRIMGREDPSYPDPTQSQNERHEFSSKSSRNKREFKVDENSTTNGRPKSHYHIASKSDAPKPPAHTATAGLQSSAANTSNSSLKKTELAVSFGDLLALSGDRDNDTNNQWGKANDKQDRFEQNTVMRRSSSLRGIKGASLSERSENHVPDVPCAPSIVPSPRQSSKPVPPLPIFQTETDNSSSPLYIPQVSPTFPPSPSRTDKSIPSPDSTATAMGAFLGIVGKEGGRIRDSAALFDYFYDEAERRIKMQEGSNESVVNGSVNLMD